MILGRLGPGCQLEIIIWKNYYQSMISLAHRLCHMSSLLYVESVLILLLNKKEISHM